MLADNHLGFYNLDSVISHVPMPQSSSLLGSFCSCTGQFVSYLIETLNRFSHNEAQNILFQRVLNFFVQTRNRDVGCSELVCSFSGFLTI